MPNDSEQIPQQPNHTGAEKFVERFDVVDGSSHEAPHRIAVEIGHVLRLQMRKYLHPEIVHRPLAGVFSGVSLNEKKHKS